MLCKPDLLNVTYREIAAAARVALGTIGPVIKELENRRHITPLLEGGRVGARKFLVPERLVQEWVAAYPTVLRPKLNIRRFRAQQAGWTKGLALQRYHAFWGGEVAANRLLHHLEPETATIYVRDTAKQIITEHNVRNHTRTCSESGEQVNAIREFKEITQTRDDIRERGLRLSALIMEARELVRSSLCLTLTRTNLLTD